MKEMRIEFEEGKTMISDMQFLAKHSNEIQFELSERFPKATKISQVQMNETRNNAKGKAVAGPNSSSLKELPYSAKLVHLTEEEYRATPKYMKGRFSLDSFNSLVDEFNDALKTKYDFYLKGFNAMASIIDKKKYQGMKTLETKDTKGKFFLVNEDFKKCAALKSESNRRSFFPVLRHCKRIREIRGPGAILRYATISN